MDANLDRIAKALATRRAAIAAAGAALALPAARPAAAKKKKKCNACCPKKKRGFSLIQFTHASPNAPAVDIYVNGSLAFDSVPYGGNTGQTDPDSGPVRVVVVPAGASPDMDPPLLDLTFPLEACRSYLFAIAGLLPGLGDRALAGVIGTLFEQNLSKITDETTARAWALHLSPDAPVVSVALEGPSASGYGVGGQVLATNIQFGDESAPVEIPAGAYTVVVRDADTDAELLRVPGQVFPDRALTAFALIGLSGGTPALDHTNPGADTCCGTYTVTPL